MIDASRLQQLRDAGRIPFMGIGYETTRDPSRATHVLLQLGLQPSGRYLYMPDLDSHKDGQDADAAREAFIRAHPDIAAKIEWQQTPRGWHGFFESYAQLPTGPIYDADGRHVGELLGADHERTIDPGDIRPGTLTPTQNEQLTAFWTVRGAADAGGDRWTVRAKEGRKLAAGWQRLGITIADLRAFLVEKCGKVGQDLDALFDQRKPFNRSDAAGSLLQCMLFNIHKIAPSAGYADRCRLAYAYWMAADSYGKADDRDYNAERDGAALLAKILNEDPRLDGTRWRAPFWTKAHPTPPAVVEEPEPPRRPAHRPAGDRERMLRKIQRYLDLRAFECGPRLYYDVDDLAACFKIARRTMQTYLRDLQAAGLIRERGQDPGPGGRAWLIWGADNSAETAETVDKSAPIWGADSVPIERIATPQSADPAPNAKEDHQNPSAPALEPGGAAYDPQYDTSAGGQLRPFVDPTVPRMRLGIGDAPAPRRSRRTPKHRQQTTFTRQDGALKKAIARRQPGLAPAPSPHRPRAGLPLEPLPDVLGSGSAAPIGAYRSGDLPGASAGAPPSAGDLIARLKQDKARREERAERATTTTENTSQRRSGYV